MHGSPKVRVRRQQLSAQEVAVLEELPGWIWDPLSDPWDVNLRMLSDFVMRDGHARVPQSYRKDDFRLAAWVSSQRAPYGKGNLSSNRSSRLEKVPISNQLERRITEQTKLRTCSAFALTVTLSSTEGVYMQTPKHWK